MLRSVRLFRLFLAEQADPDGFYSALAKDTAAQLTDHVELGNLDSQRDWGYAPDFVRAMWMMLQQTSPGDYVIATGETHSVREFCEIAFDHVGLDWQRHVRVAERYLRPAEVDLLIGDAARAHEVLGWKPEISFEDLVRMMVDADVAALKGSS